MGRVPRLVEQINGDAERCDTGGDDHQLPGGMLHQGRAPVLGRGIIAAGPRAFHQDQDGRDAECRMGQARHDLAGPVGIALGVIAFIFEVHDAIDQPPQRIGEQACGRNGQQHGTKRLADKEIQRAGGAFSFPAIQGREEGEAANDQVNHAPRPISGPHQPFESGIGMVGHQGPFCV